MDISGLKGLRQRILNSSSLLQSSAGLGISRIQERIRNLFGRIEEMQSLSRSVDQNLRNLNLFPAQLQKELQRNDSIQGDRASDQIAGAGSLAEKKGSSMAELMRSQLRDQNQNSGQLKKLLNQNSSNNDLYFYRPDAGSFKNSLLQQLKEQSALDGKSNILLPLMQKILSSKSNVSSESIPAKEISSSLSANEIQSQNNSKVHDINGRESISETARSQGKNFYKNSELSEKNGSESRERNQSSGNLLDFTR